MSKIFHLSASHNLSLEESKIFKKYLNNIEKALEEKGFNYLKLPVYDIFYNQLSILEDYDDLILIKEPSGNTLVLRMDMTGQVVRHVVSLKDKEFPLKIYYSGEIFKLSNKLESEYQVGIEYIGYNSIEAVFETILSLKEALSLVIDKPIYIYISHSDLIKALIKDIEPSFHEEIIKAIQKKNISKLRRFGLENIIFMQGKEDVFDNLKCECEDIKKRLLDLGYILQKEKIDFYYDLSEMKELPYYSGIVFDFFAYDIGFSVVSGGEYSTFKKVYNLDLNAVGGALYLSSILNL